MGKLKYDPEIQRRTSAAYYRETVRFHITPQRILDQIAFMHGNSICIKKVLLEPSVNGKGVESGDRGFHQEKSVEHFTDQKLIHEIFYVDNG